MQYISPQGFATTVANAGRSGVDCLVVGSGYILRDYYNPSDLLCGNTAALASSDGVVDWGFQHHHERKESRLKAYVDWLDAKNVSVFT
jgi:hypothetical protein